MMLPQDSEPPLAVASRWVSQVTSIALEMALPPAGGYWLDGRLGTEPWCVSAGAVLGMFVAMTSLVQLAKKTNKNSQKPPSEQSSETSDNSGALK